MGNICVSHQVPVPLGVCQLYTGVTCDAYLRNKTVFVPPHIRIEELEERLKAAYGVIRESKDMNPNCRGYALPSLCHSILPTCRTPEKTNHQYFANRARAVAAEVQRAKKAAAAAARTTTTTTTTEKISTTFTLLTSTATDPATSTIPSEYNIEMQGDEPSFFSSGSSSSFQPPTRSSENLRRICRTECELLENELCQKEYAIAKRHPTIGQKLQLEDCHDLPDTSDCLRLGIHIDVDPSEKCYWENGSSYRGTVAESASGKRCQPWARLMKELADYPELAGQNYCR